MKIARLSPAAEADLVEIWLYVARDKIDAADRLIAKLQVRCDLLARNPSAGRARGDIGSGVRSFPVGRYVIYYRAASDGIDVARILSGYRDPTGLIQGYGRVQGVEGTRHGRRDMS